MCFDCTSVCGLHVSPSHGAPRATPKSKKKHYIFQNLLFYQEMQKYYKKGFQTVSKRVNRFPGWRPWGRLARHNLISISKIIQKCSTGVQKWCKSAAKVPPGTDNYSKKYPTCGNMFLNVPPKNASIPFCFCTFLVVTGTRQKRSRCFKKFGCVTIKNEPRAKKTSIFTTEEM